MKKIPLLIIAVILTATLQSKAVNLYSHYMNDLITHSIPEQPKKKIEYQVLFRRPDTISLQQ